MPKKGSRSRAVIRIIEAGCSAVCAHCDQQVKFRARIKALQVICNVYDGDTWVRVEHYHGDCYQEAGTPYGAADESHPMRPRARSAAATAPATPSSDSAAA